MVASLTHSVPHVLLTGSTGLVGGIVLARLLETEIPVAVLVRGNRRQSATARVEALMQRLEERMGRLFVRPVVLVGDLCERGLGLSDSDRHWIASNCGSVIHSAANLLFRPASEHPDNEPYRTNVEGTRNLLEVVTSAQITEWHYVSTAYIAGLRSGRVLEQESGVGQQFGNDYERSKTLAEQLLNQSAAIGSLTVYRPSIVIDLHPTTSMRSDQTINSAFVMFQTLSQRFGLPDRGEWFRRLGFGGDERKNIVTVDWVATMIAQIYRRPALHGATYHLTSPNGTSSSLLEDGFRAAVQDSGVKLPPRRPEAMALIDEHAAPFVSAFKPYFRDDPKFDRSNTSRAMQVCGERDVPELSVEHLRDFCMRQTRPLSPLAATTTQTSAWNQFASDNLSHSAIMSQTEERGSLTGLELSGEGGGQWLIERNLNHLQLHVAAANRAAVRWITTALTMDELINDRLTVRNALDAGRLILEIDNTEESANPRFIRTRMETVIHEFAELVADIQRRTTPSRDQKSEVAYVR